ncbi:cysteine hydrolase family protein [Actinomycetes bacterium M1A6_2h]
MTTGLLIVDIQNDYFPGGAFPLVGPDAAAAAAAKVLSKQRESGAPVVHVQHVWDGPDATFMRPGTPGIEINDAVAPTDGEPVVQKNYPNSFRDTGLHEKLQSLGVDSLVVVGMMSSMCVDATVRAADDLGYPVTVVHDACAAPDVDFDGASIPGAQVHSAVMGALGSMIATVTSSEELLAQS